MFVLSEHCFDTYTHSVLVNNNIRYQQDNSAERFPMNGIQLPPGFDMSSVGSFINVDFKNATLKSVNFGDEPLDCANFDGAELENAIIQSFTNTRL